MNVIVSNKQKEIIDNANIDAIKDLNGIFTVDDLVNKFKNYFFSKMILDATSVIDFATKDVLKKLSDEIGSDRLIILLPSTPEPPDEFKKMLIDLKIFNFSNNIDDVVKFIEKPNTYENAMNTIMNSYTNNNGYYVDSSIKDSEDTNSEMENETNFNNEDNGNLNSIVNNGVADTSSREYSHTSLGDIMNRFNVYDDSAVTETVSDDTPADITEKTEVTEKEEIQAIPEVKVEDNLNNNEEVNQVVNQIEDNVSSSPIFLNMDGYDDFVDSDSPKEKLIIGFKNVTEHAGSTTLVYLLQKEAKKQNKDVIAIEVNKNDFKLFRHSKMISVKEDELSNTLNSLNESLVLVDLNDCNDDSFCNDVVYLVEPSTIKLNKLMMTDKEIFTTLKDKKVILNQSMLSDSDVSILEKEANMVFLMNICSINDRIDNSIISELFDKIVNI